LNLSTQAGLGIVFTADPVVDEIVSTCLLELYVVTFESQYYTTTQGRKKLKQVELEIQKLSTVRHPKLITVFAVKLHIPHSSGPPQLMVLSEQLPALTLHDVLEDSEFLREDRVSVCLFLYFWISVTDCYFRITSVRF
jgi:translation initiation factor 2-alpha kinase 4